MPFERLLEIECRLDDILRQICNGSISMPKFDYEVGVSIPIIFRNVPIWRLIGQDIWAENHRVGWRYLLKKNRNSWHFRPEEANSKGRKAVSEWSGPND